MNANISGLLDPVRLLRARKEARLTQAGLAKKAGVTSVTICLIERGRVTPSMATVEKLKAALPSLSLGAPAAFNSALAGARKIFCPHCDASSYTFSENPEVEYKCVSCSRSFRVGKDGRGFIPPPARTPKTHDAWHRNGKGKRI